MKELGDLIRAARQQRGITLEQASAETRIRRQYLDAIEDGDLGTFPGTAYAAGFLRNYSTYLGLNSDEILQTYHAISPPQAVTIAPATTVGVERLRRRSRRRFMWLFAGVLMVILAAALIQRYNADQRGAAKPLMPPASTSGLPASAITHSSRAKGDQALHQSALNLPVAVIGVRAVQTAWVHVVVNGHQAYWGPISTGKYREWSGHRVKMSAHRGTAFQLRVDGSQAGLLSHANKRVVIVANPQTWYRTE